jgi:hypothetical protein
MNDSIKVGDKIKCVYGDHLNNYAFLHGMLTFGKIYKIVSIYDELKKRVEIELDTGRLTYIYMVYDEEVWFEKVEEYQIDFLSILKGY